MPGEIVEGGFGADRLQQGIQRELITTMTQDNGCHERRPQRSDFQPRRRHFEETVGMIIEAGHLSPRIQIGVFHAPVVILAAHPIVHVDDRPIDYERSGEACRRQGDQTLGFGQPRLIQNALLSDRVGSARSWLVDARTQVGR